MEQLGECYFIMVQAFSFGLYGNISDGPTMKQIPYPILRFCQLQTISKMTGGVPQGDVTMHILPGFTRRMGKYGLALGGR